MTRAGAIVTGASSGIGRAIALRLAADAIVAAGGRGVHVEADVARSDDCERLLTIALERSGRLDVVVNNAAIAGRHSRPLIDTEEADFDAIMAVNLCGPFLLCRAGVRQMLAQDLRDEVRGRIVNITSQHGMVGAPGHFGYAVSKGGLIQMTRQIAVEHGADGILCNCVSPGKIVTGTPGDLSASEAGLEYVRSRTPFFRLGRPEDVAAAVSYLAGDASYTSGANLMVDGGWTAY
jgi:NAD(P)-dependent dehydrogenase (short-subunit alcohol dehydrogenase family)